MKITISTLKEGLFVIGRKLERPVGYFLMFLMTVGLICGLLIAPVLMLTEKFGTLGGVIWLLSLAFLIYLGRNLGLPTKWD